MAPVFTETPLAEIDEIYSRLSETFASHKTLKPEYRLYNLKQLAYLFTDNEVAIQEAIKSDLSKGAFDVNVGDIWPALSEIDLAVKRLDEWMKDEKGTRDATAMFKMTRPRVVRQPKGVSLIIGAWNYPFQLSLSPLVGAIAAGCPAIVKCSEHAPASAALMAELVPRYLDPDGYAVVNGGVEQSTALLKKRWGHILYTGGGPVGKIVARAAADTLTPTTLELGGKSPVIVAADADLTVTAKRMFSIKHLGLGQMCVSPDYVLVAKERADEFVKECIKTLDEFYPKGSERSLIKEGGEQQCALRNDRDYERIANMIDDADIKGKLVYRGEADPSRRRMGISLVRLNRNGEGEDTPLVRDEIFGPVLPIIPVDDVDAAVAYINARPTPLALYVCSSDRKTFLDVVQKTLSGAAIWNDFAMSPVSRTLPFGGVGESGWGNYHGENGFLAFSHRKAVMEVPLWMEIAQKSRYAPKLNLKMLKMVMATKIGFARPTSVEGERKLLERQRARKHLYLGFLITLFGALVGFLSRTSRGASVLAAVQKALHL